jgi:hypothetical protein
MCVKKSLQKAFLLPAACHMICGGPFPNLHQLMIARGIDCDKGALSTTCSLCFSLQGRPG